MLHILRKHRTIAPLAENAEWDALLEQGLVAGWSFDKLFEDVSNSAAALKTECPMNISDMVSHIADVNYAVANILEAFTKGRSLTYDQRALYRGAGGRPFQVIREDHSNSLLRLAESTGRPINPEQVSWHFEYGRLNGKEWLATIQPHYAYHTRQVERIKASSAYRSGLKAPRGSREAVK